MYTSNKRHIPVTTGVSLAATIASAVLLSGTSQAAEPGWYAGAGVGHVFVDRNVSDFDDGSITSGRVDNHDSGRKLFVGYRVNEAFAIEAGYVDLNNDLDEETTFNGNSDGSGSRYAAGAVSVDIDEPTGWFAVAVGSAPLSERVSLNGRLGALAWEADETTRDANGERTRKRDGTSAVLGVDLEYRFPNNIALRGGWELFQSLASEDYDFLSVSALYYLK